MALLMKSACEKCGRKLEAQAEAFICSYECTFCRRCTDEMKAECPNCGGELSAAAEEGCNLALVGQALRLPRYRGNPKESATLALQKSRFPVLDPIGQKTFLPDDAHLAKRTTNAARQEFLG